MGIEEYQFLTKTMEQIESDSISLDEVKNDLKKLDKRISKMDDKSRHNWDEFNSFKKTMEKENCLLYTSPSPRDATLSRMPSSA